MKFSDKKVPVPVRKCCAAEAQNGDYLTKLFDSLGFFTPEYVVSVNYLVFSTSLKSFTNFYRCSKKHSSSCSIDKHLSILYDYYWTIIFIIGAAFLAFSAPP